MTANQNLRETQSKPVVCTVVILHESQEALTRATALCDQITAEFWNDLDIDLAHWAMESLGQEPHAEDAAAKAAVADILVVAAQGAGVLPEEFSSWTERWLAQRKYHEGTLVGLFESGTEPGQEQHSWDIQMHQLALSAGMDYLKRLPHTRPHGIPDSTDWCTSRAETFTGTLDQIIRSNANRFLS